MKRNTSYQHGFTLVELVVVILILGILSATALPRFIDFGSSAKASHLASLRGSIESQIDMIRAKAVADGLGAQGTGDVKVNSDLVELSNGYPLTVPSTGSTAVDFLDLLDLGESTDFAVTGSSASAAGRFDDVIYYYDGSELVLGYQRNLSSKDTTYTWTDANATTLKGNDCRVVYNPTATPLVSMSDDCS